eukprot:gnl/MRDRNA2_/MRDRNA2_293438_c0_seq1.p1 gnl/MRDRNA2_/MRDRNA2_293438_c0~~gnl/MRDRNA2_/MRDRNA2_293438_c0_seq1.p1  ORF type:complete len:155 (+),score=31.12 gnl/MRDRNA2_/MRDRNA2_293438_c0_seq1:359-823(+)
MNIERGSAWLHGSVDLSDWPSDVPQEYKSLPYGDRRQELVFIGSNIKEANLRKRLERALVTDAEFQRGREVWARWPNPFRFDFDEAPPQEEQITKTSMKKTSTKKAATKSTSKNASAQKKPTAGSKNAKLASSKRKRMASPQAHISIRKKPARA